MSNVENFQLAHAVKFYSDDVLSRLVQIQALASKNPKRAGHKAIALVCQAACTDLEKEWRAFLAVSVSLNPRIHLKLASAVRSKEAPSVFLSIEAFTPGPIEPAIFVNHVEKLIAWQSEWVRTRAKMVWSLSLPVFAVIAHMALHERTRIEEMTASRVVFLSRGPGCRGWAMVTIDLTVAEKDVTYMADAMARLEANSLTK